MPRADRDFKLMLGIAVGMSVIYNEFNWFTKLASHPELQSIRPLYHNNDNSERSCPHAA